ncbi:MAG: DUF11 domain-containing protein [Acidobacteriaceae bacterium]|nr:DUF11 domain-containing protein [Acidobacteriaceae bacterium]
MLTVVAPPSIAGAFGAGSIMLSGTTSLTFTITNPNATVALTGVAFTNSLPLGLAIATPSGLASTCGGTPAATPVSATLTLSGGTIPAASSCTVSVNVTASLAGNKTDVTSAVTSQNGADGNQATVMLNVLAPDLTITKTHPGSFRQGDAADTYTIVVSNGGAGSTAGQVTVTDQLPTGLTAVAMSGYGWTCAVNTVSCTRFDALLPASSYPAITLTVAVAASAAPALMNTATVSGGGELNTANDTANDGTVVIQVADLVVSSVHGQAFQHGMAGVYTLTLSNVGPGPTSAAVTLTDTLPAGLTATAISGDGWTCTLTPLSCTRADILNAGASFPPVTLTVAVANDTPLQVANTAAVSGGGELNTTNNSASDTTAVTAGVPASITAVSTTQSPAYVNLGYIPFVARVFDAGQVPVPNASVTFNANGAGTFRDGSTTVVVTTDTTGTATSPILIAGNAGTYTITATVTGVSTPANFPISVVSGTISAQPSALTFTYKIGDPLPVPSQAVTVASDLAYNVNVSSDTGWLSAAPGSGSIAVSVNPAGLTPGTYQGSIQITSDKSFGIPVTLQITGPSLTASTGTLSFSAVFGGTAAAQTVSIASGGSPVSIAASSDSAWLTVTASGTTPATVTVNVSTQGLAPGTYTGHVQITSSNAPNSPLIIPVNLTITAVPAITIGAVANSASFLRATGAPNTILTMFGSMACSTALTVLVDGSPVDSFGATSGQISFVLPPTIAVNSQSSIVIDCGGRRSDPISLPIVPDAPAIYTVDFSGKGAAAALNQDDTLNTGSNPAARGSYLSLFVTGFGTFQAAGPDGLEWLTADVQAFVGDTPAVIQFAGHAPQSSPGLQQINIQIPADAATGAAVPIRLVVNGVSTQTGVTVAVQ